MPGAPGLARQGQTPVLRPLQHCRAGNANKGRPPGKAAYACFTGQRADWEQAGCAQQGIAHSNWDIQERGAAWRSTWGFSRKVIRDVEED